MARLFPFRAYRYDTSRAGDLSLLVTQPYDKISEDLLDRYLSRSPYNVARVIKNPDYTAAGEFFRQWLTSGILQKDHDPSLYPYEQVFQSGGRECSRLGFIGLVSLKDSEIAVRGHERILKGPLEDRLRLIRETQSNDGLIFSLFSDPALKVDHLLRESCEVDPPVAEAKDDFGVVNRIWQLRDPRIQREIRLAFEAFTLYIADGHHRFETARIYAEECQNQRWKPAAVESYDKRMMAFFNMNAPGLQVLPTHRAVRDLSSVSGDDLLSRLEKWFEITNQESVERLRAEMGGFGHRFGLVLARPFRFYSLRLRENLTGFMPGLEGPARSLDVNILHQGILQPLLGIGEKELAQQSHVDYFRSEAEMVDQVRAGHYQLAFLLNPTRLEQIRQISEAGDKMPQKSTDFFPKLLTGLVFMKMEIATKGG